MQWKPYSIYGSGRQGCDISSKWSGNFSAQTSDGKQKLNVYVNVNIGLYEGKEKNDPFIIPESWNPFNRDNFVEIVAGDESFYVLGGDEGEWRSQGRSGLTLAHVAFELILKINHWLSVPNF